MRATHILHYTILYPLLYYYYINSIILLYIYCIILLHLLYYSIIYIDTFKHMHIPLLSLTIICTDLTLTLYLTPMVSQKFRHTVNIYVVCVLLQLCQSRWLPRLSSYCKHRDINRYVKVLERICIGLFTMYAYTIHIIYIYLHYIRHSIL